MKKFLSLFLIAGTSIWCLPAIAQNASATPTKTIKKAPPKSAAAKVKPAIAQEDDDKEHDVTGSTVTEYQCELGNVVTIYENPGNDQLIGMRWNKKVHGLTRVGTSTGANRFESKKGGLVWIGIPAKGMLLDSRRGKQLANECKTAEQMAPKKIAVDETPKALKAPEAPETPKTPETAKQ